MKSFNKELKVSKNGSDYPGMDECFRGDRNKREKILMELKEANFLAL